MYCLFVLSLRFVFFTLNVCDYDPGRSRRCRNIMYIIISLVGVRRFDLTEDKDHKSG